MAVVFSNMSPSEIEVGSPTVYLSMDLTYATDIPADGIQPHWYKFYWTYDGLGGYLDSGWVYTGAWSLNETRTYTYLVSLLSDKNYSWKVEVSDWDDESHWSAEYDFTTAFGKATNPSPADDAADVVLTSNLSWTAGSGAVTHLVYFGTDPTPDVTEFKVEQSGTTYALPELEPNTNYYWRIDEKTESDTITGDVWSFTTVGPEVGATGTISITSNLSGIASALTKPPKATNPFPTNMAGNCKNILNLTWELT